MHEGRQRQQWDHTSHLLWMASHSRTATPDTFNPFAKSAAAVHLLEPGQASALRPPGIPGRTIKARRRSEQEAHDGN